MTMISKVDAYPDITSIYNQGREWSMILTCFPMAREQEISCAKSLQRGWENFDNARKLYDPVTFSALPKRSTLVSTELGRPGYFRQCSELHRAASQLSSSIQPRTGMEVQDVGPSAVSPPPSQLPTNAIRMKNILDSVYLSIEEAMSECRSSVIRVPDMGYCPDRKLNSLDTGLRPLKKYVKTLRGHGSSSAICEGEGSVDSSRVWKADRHATPILNNSGQALSPTLINGNEGDALWSAVLDDIPLITAQQASCAYYLQSGWRSLDLARQIYTFDPEQPATPSLPDQTVSYDLDRKGYFQECSELSRAADGLSSYIDAQEARYDNGETKRGWAVSGYSLTEARRLLGCVSRSVEKVREECRSLDIHVPDWGDETESKLEHLEEEIRRMRRYVRTLEDGIGHGGILTPSGLEKPSSLWSSPSTPTEHDCQSIIA